MHCCVDLLIWYRKQLAGNISKLCSVSCEQCELQGIRLFMY